MSNQWFTRVFLSQKKQCSSAIKIDELYSWQHSSFSAYANTSKIIQHVTATKGQREREKERESAMSVSKKSRILDMFASLFEICIVVFTCRFRNKSFTALKWLFRANNMWKKIFFWCLYFSLHNSAIGCDCNCKCSQCFKWTPWKSPMIRLVNLRLWNTIFHIFTFK